MFMLGSMESFAKPKPVVTPSTPPIYLLKGQVVALRQPDARLTRGLPFLEVSDGMLRWLIGDQSHRLIYLDLKASLQDANLTFHDLEGHCLYRARVPGDPQRRRRTVSEVKLAYSGLIANRMKQLITTIDADPNDSDSALKLYQMLGEKGRAVLENHLKDGPIIDDGYEMPDYQASLVDLGLLTRCVIKGHTGSTVGNLRGLTVYNAGVAKMKARR